MKLIAGQLPTFMTGVKVVRKYVDGCKCLCIVYCSSQQNKANHVSVCLQLSSSEPLQKTLGGVAKKEASNRAAFQLLRRIKPEQWAKLNGWAFDIFGVKQLVTRGAPIQAVHAAERLVEAGALQIAKQTGKSAAKEAGKSAAKEAGKSAAKEAGKSAAREASKSAAREGSKSIAKKGSKAVAKEGTKVAVLNLSQMVPFIGGAITAGMDTYFVVHWAWGQDWQVLKDAAKAL